MSVPSSPVPEPRVPESAVPKSLWTQKIEQDPGHSQWYIERFRTMAREGADLVGEARLIDAMVGRDAHILDAGCGPGRLGGYLHQVGHRVVGIDVDPALIAAAEQDHPGPTWLVGDLAELDLPARGIADPFDAIVCAGNVMGFAHPDTRLDILRRLGEHLTGEGRLLVGYGAGRGYDFPDFLDHVAAAGLVADVLLESWDMRAFTADSEFIVASLRRA